jgi:putative salt-induced outer membrane protein
MRYLKKGLVITLWVLASDQALADWRGSGQLGIVQAHGNTKSSSANAKIDAVDQLDMWKHTFGFDALYSESDEVTSGNRWDAAWQSDYKLTEKLFWFGGLRYEDDKYGAFSYQATATTGIGYKFYDTDTTKLSAQIGAGFKRSKPQTLVKDPDSNVVIDRIDGDASNRGVVTGGIDFEHALTPNTKVLNKFLVEAASDNTFMQNDLALQVSMTDRLALSIGYQLRENTSPPPDQHRLDSLTTLNLVYKFQ